MKTRLQNQEISWLTFNDRVLEESADRTVPLMERIKFLGIFSSNLDEFFRVKVANLRRLALLGKKAAKIINYDPKETLKTIHKIVVAQQLEFQKIYQEILNELERHSIFIVDDSRLEATHAEFVKNYFQRRVRHRLVPLMIDGHAVPRLKDGSIYMAIRLSKSNRVNGIHALMEIPTDVLPRFLTLPNIGQHHYIMFLDDVIRYCLDDIFATFKYNRIDSYSIKLTRDARLDIDGGLEESYMRKISKSLRQRSSGRPVRFVYDAQIPEHFLKLIAKKLRLGKLDSTLIAEGRYQNFKDLMSFPNLGPSRLLERSSDPLPHKDMSTKRSIFVNIRKKDILLLYPYQTFDYVVDFLREAAIDPKVKSVMMTLYRVAKNSNVINALICAARNGKSVTVVMELQASFDEEPNIEWSEKLEQEGVKVIHGVPGLKVHAKLILVSRDVKGKKVLYTNIGTGNFNESTANIYSDHSLFTADVRITSEVQKVFDLIESDYKRVSFRHLLVSPFNFRQNLIKLINSEIANAQNGKQAYIVAKLNNLSDKRIIKKLYQASQAGVEIRLMVRGMISLIPGVDKMSENIRVTRTIDKFLEHSRLFVFCGAGEGKYYLSSADWMTRNLDRRLEVSCPIYDAALQNEVKDFLNIHWQDNVKATSLNEDFDRQNSKTSSGESIRAQVALRQYFENKLKDNATRRTKVAAKDKSLAQGVVKRA